VLHAAPVNPHLKNASWRAQLFARLPARWARVIERRVREADIKHGDWHHANSYLREHASAWQETIFRLDASIEDIRQSALKRADEAAGLVARLASVDAIVEALRALCQRWRVAFPDVETDGGAIARVLDARWWNRRLRVEHGRKVEAHAIRLGMVSAKADKYISEENLRRGRAQDTRNAETLARTLAVNEDGECFSLAELAAKSISNKRIRRGELMLRMRGMEEVAADYGCVAEFAVVTAPSRFHAVRADGTPNPKYDPANTPRECQAYLTKQFAACRSWLHRNGVPFFGMRTVEAHQDGTPHWNLLVFLPDNAAVQAWRMAIIAYFLENDPQNDAADEETDDKPGREKGARARRVRFETIDAAKGGATGYIAKYISKNVDGHGLETDLAGDPIMQTVQRVEQWAKLHGIRMFQPIGGGAPVTAWREFRRIEGAAIQGAPEAVQRAWIAAQRVPGQDEADDKRADYAEFIRAYGGPYTKRKDGNFRLHKVEQKGLGRYGEPLGMRPAGIAARGMWAEDKGGIVGVIQVFAEKVVPSVRREWTIARSADARVLGRSVSASAERAPSRTRVNNCTGDANETGKHGDFQSAKRGGNHAYAHGKGEIVRGAAARGRGSAGFRGAEADGARGGTTHEGIQGNRTARRSGRAPVNHRDSRDISTSEGDQNA
jgi:hypothetical protein